MQMARTTMKYQERVRTHTHTLTEVQKHKCMTQDVQTRKCNSTNTTATSFGLWQTCFVFDNLVLALATSLWLTVLTLAHPCSFRSIVFFLRFDFGAITLALATSLIVSTFSIGCCNSRNFSLPGTPTLSLSLSRSLSRSLCKHTNCKTKYFCLSPPQMTSDDP